MREIEPLTKEQARRVEENMGLIGAFIRRYPPPQFIPLEDYHGELCVGLVTSASTYREDGGSSFSTWSFHQLMGIRSNIMRKYLLPAKHEKQPGEEMGLDWIPSKDNPSEEIDLSEKDKEFLFDEFSQMTEQEKELLIGDATVREMARRAGVSHTAMSSRKRNAAFRLRRKIFPRLDDEWARQEGFFRILKPTGGNGNDRE